MISGMSTLLEDVIIALSLRNMFLSIGKIGHEGPSINLGITVGPHDINCS